MKFSNVIRDYFSFNRKEQRGLFVLLSVLAVIILADVFISEVMPQKNFDFSVFEKDVDKFEKEIARLDSMEKLGRVNGYKAGYNGNAGYSFDSARISNPPAREIFIIELNSTDTFELQRLKGIGPSFARRIIRYRERLGGYLDKSQLLEVFGMDTAKYNEISDHLSVNPDSIHRINLNDVTFKQLMSHPYFPFEMTKNIMIYRKDHKKFKNPDEVLLIKNVSDSAYKKIKPYVRTE